MTGFPILDRIIQLEDEDSREDLLDILSGSHYTAEHVAHTLTGAGFPVSASTIRTYRRSLKRKV